MEQLFVAVQVDRLGQRLVCLGDTIAQTTRRMTVMIWPVDAVSSLHAPSNRRASVLLIAAELWFFFALDDNRRH